jgi:hypothetical protein
MRKLVLSLLLLASAGLAGCSTGGMRPLADTPPAPFLTVPQRFYIMADRDSAGGDAASRERRADVARSGRVGGDGGYGGDDRTACVGVFVTGAVIGATTELAGDAASGAMRGHGSGYQLGCELPPGKYLPVGEDGLGFFYQAPVLFTVDGTDLVTGGIYWRNSVNGPGGVYYDWGHRQRPMVQYSREVGPKVIVPAGR